MAIVVDVRIKAAPALSSLKAMQRAIGKINASAKDLNTTLQSVQQSAAKASQSIARQPSGGGGGGSSRSRTRAPRVQDPFASNPLAGMRYFAPGARVGDPFAISQFRKYNGMNSSRQRTQAAAQQFLQNGGSPMSAMLGAILNRTRFGQIAGKMVGMPLGIDIQRLLMSGQGGALASLMGGAGGAGGPASGALSSLMPAIAGFGAVAGAAGIALTAMAASAKMAQDALMRWGASLVSGGGSLGQARAASRVGAALGVDLSSVGRNLMNGYGPIAAAGAGVNPFGGPFGDNDYNAKGLKVLDYVRRAKSFSEARRRAELAGSPELASAYLLDKDTYGRLTNARKGGASPEGIRSAAKMQANIEIVKDQFSDLMVRFAGPVLEAAAKGLGAISNALSKVPWGIVMRGASVFQMMLEDVAAKFVLLGKVLEFIRNLILKIRDMIPQNIRKQLGWDEQKKSVDSNTQALNRLNDTVQGTFGGGARAQAEANGKLHPGIGMGHNQLPNYGIL